MAARIGVFKIDRPSDRVDNPREEVIGLGIQLRESHDGRRLASQGLEQTNIFSVERASRAWVKRLGSADHHLGHIASLAAKLNSRGA